MRRQPGRFPSREQQRTPARRAPARTSRIAARCPSRARQFEQADEHPEHEQPFAGRAARHREHDADEAMRRRRATTSHIRVKMPCTSGSHEARSDERMKRVVRLARDAHLPVVELDTRSSAAARRRAPMTRRGYPKASEREPGRLDHARLRPCEAQIRPQAGEPIGGDDPQARRRRSRRRRTPPRLW